MLEGLERSRERITMGRECRTKLFTYLTLWFRFALRLLWTRKVIDDFAFQLFQVGLSEQNENKISFSRDGQKSNRRKLTPRAALRHSEEQQ